MLFEQAVQWGRELSGQEYFDSYVRQLNTKLIVQKVLSNRVPDKSWLIDPQTNLPYGSETILEGGETNMPAIGNEASILVYDVPVGWNGVISNLAIVYTGGGFVSGSGGCYHVNDRELSISPVEQGEEGIFQSVVVVWLE